MPEGGEGNRAGHRHVASWFGRMGGCWRRCRACDSVKIAHRIGDGDAGEERGAKGRHDILTARYGKIIFESRASDGHMGGWVMRDFWHGRRDECESARLSRAGAVGAGGRARTGCPRLRPLKRRWVRPYAIDGTEIACKLHFVPDLVNQNVSSFGGMGWNAVVKPGWLLSPLPPTGRGR